MEKSTLRCALLNALAFLCMVGTASASPPGPDPGLLSLVPPGAALVAHVTYGTEPTYLVLTRINTADLTAFQSISGVDPTRMITRTIFVAARTSQGHISEHTLLASGHFDAHHIFKAAIENGAAKTEYLGIPILIVPPLDRDKGISRDLRWLAFLDSQVAVFGTVPMVQEELCRYLARSPADLPLILKLSHLRKVDQSWCVLTPTVYNSEIVRRMLATLDPGFGQPNNTDHGLIMGVHFGKKVEIEYESLTDSANSDESPPQARPVFSPSLSQIAPRPASFLSNSDTNLPRVIKFSQKQYDAFIAQVLAREQAQGAWGPNCCAVAQAP